MDTREGIKRAAERARGAPAAFLEEVPVVETFRGEVLWEGSGGVHAWAVEGDKEPQFIAVLDQPPVDSPIAVMRAWLVSQNRKL